MGINCAPLLADIVPCSYEAEFIQKRIKDNKIIQKLKPLISLSILMKFCQLTIQALLPVFY